jgi:hypothetical protein
MRRRWRRKESARVRRKKGGGARRLEGEELIGV